MDQFIKSIAPQSGIGHKRDEDSGEQEVQEEEEQLQAEVLLRDLSSEFIYCNFSVTIEKAHLVGVSMAQVSFSVEAGQDWIVASGTRQGATQNALKEAGGYFTFNFPFDIFLKSTNVYGWPQICVAVVVPDALGRKTTGAYGCVHLPCSSGTSSKSVQLFRPLSMSKFTGLLGWLKGCAAEIKNHNRVLAEGKGREVMRVATVGQLLLRFNMNTIGLNNRGYR